jgi:hypothetical protein
MRTAFSTDPIAPGVPPCSPCQRRRRATEQRETSQTAGSDVALRELEEFWRQHQQDPSPNSGKGAR